MFFLGGNYFFSLCLIYCRIFCKENSFLFVVCWETFQWLPSHFLAFRALVPKPAVIFCEEHYLNIELSNIWLIFACNISVVWMWHSDRLNFHMHLTLYIQLCSIVNLQQPWFWDGLDFLFVKLITQLSDLYCFIFFASASQVTLSSTVSQNLNVAVWIPGHVLHVFFTTLGSVKHKIMQSKMK